MHLQSLFFKLYSAFALSSDIWLSIFIGDGVSLAIADTEAD